MIPVPLPPQSALAGQPLQPDEMYGLLLQEAEFQNYPGEWYFKGSERYITRALRIPYVYYKASATPGAGGALVREHLLIGYEGAGGGN